MKNFIYKNLLIFLFLLFSSLSFSQSNLQFNTVITKTGTLSGGGNSTVNTQTFTVPAGKVWKIERYTRDALEVNGVRIKDIYTLPNTSTGFLVLDNAPLWLNEGDSFILFFVNQSNYSFSPLWYFSLLEFNK